MKSEQTTKLNRVESIALSRSDTKKLILMFITAYHLAYCANLIIRNYYADNGYSNKLRNWDYGKLCRWMRSKNQYKKYWLPQLGSRCSDQVVRQVFTNWTSFFKAKIAFKADPSKFKAAPKPPWFIKPHLRGPKYHTLLLHNLQIKIVDDNIKLISVPQVLKNLTLKSSIAVKVAEQIKGARISTPRDGIATFHLIYEITPHESEILSSKSNPNRVVSIDIGVNNLIAIFNNFNKQPVLINGKPVKSINQRYNKEKARLTSIYDKLKQKYRGKLDKISIKRKRKIDNYFHKSSRWLINYCVDNNVEVIIIGKNDGWKQSVNLGKKNNQNFVYIPFNRLLEMIVYKAEVKGILVIFTEENYTSKCSFLDGEFPQSYTSYLGKRVKKLFRSADGTLPYLAKYNNIRCIDINADVNGAFNIGMKVFPDLFSTLNKDGIKHLHPKKITFPR